MESSWCLIAVPLGLACTDDVGIPGLTGMVRGYVCRSLTATSEAGSV